MYTHMYINIYMYAYRLPLGTHKRTDLRPRRKPRHRSQGLHGDGHHQDEAEESAEVREQAAHDVAALAPGVPTPNLPVDSRGPGGPLGKDSAGLLWLGRGYLAIGGVYIDCTGLL